MGDEVEEVADVDRAIGGAGARTVIEVGVHAAALEGDEEVDEVVDVDGTVFDAVAGAVVEIGDATGAGGGGLGGRIAAAVPVLDEQLIVGEVGEVVAGEVAVGGADVQAVGVARVIGRGEEGEVVLVDVAVLVRIAAIELLGEGLLQERGAGGACGADRGQFRADLFYRLSTITLEVPPLRARREDIAPLALHFLRRANDANRRAVTGISLTVLASLEEHGWPGNARELRNAIEHAVVVTRAEMIQMSDLPAYLRAPTEEEGPIAVEAPPASPSGEDLRTQLQRHEAQLIAQALRAAGGKRAAAAQALGIPLRTLAHRIQLLGIRERPDGTIE